MMKPEDGDREKKEAREADLREIKIDVRDKGSEKKQEATGDKSAQVLSATIGGALLGNLIAPGVGGAILGGIIGAIIANNSDNRRGK